MFQYCKAEAKVITEWHCKQCHKKIDSLVPFQCRRCHHYFCEDHRLPEQHNCPNLKTSWDSWKNRQKKFQSMPKERHSPHHVPIQNEQRTNYVKPRNDNTIERQYQSYGGNRHKSHRRYTLWQTIKYRLRKLGVPLGLFVSIVLIIIFYGLYQLSHLEILSLIYYILLIVIIAYIMFSLLKRLDRISIHNDLRLFGLRILSGIIGAIGLYLSLMFLLFGMPLSTTYSYTSKAMMVSFYNMMGVGFMYPVLTFGFDFGLPFTGLIIYFGIALGCAIIGGYLFFKFQRRSGRFVWFGRI